MKTAARFLKIISAFILLSSCTNHNNSTLNLRWTEARARSWYDSLPWIKGFNYVPNYAGNTTEWWENPLDTAVIGQELGWAHDLRYTSTREFLQYIVWKSNPAAFKKNFSLFLELASSRNISVMPVLFDDCAFGLPIQLDPYLGKQRDIIPGMILSNWTPSPGSISIPDTMISTSHILKNARLSLLFSGLKKSRVKGYGSKISYRNRTKVSLVTFTA